MPIRIPLPYRDAIAVAEIGIDFGPDHEGFCSLDMRARLGIVPFRRLVRRLFLIYRVLAFIPFIPPTLEYFEFLESCTCELGRHTGAGGLVGSGAV